MLRIAVVCYPTYGGSGVVATELGLALAARGHQIHFVSYEQPFRLTSFTGDVHFHSVDVPSYPLFKFPPYLLALASKLYEIHAMEPLDLIHAHYAIPHATAGYLARQMLRNVPRLVTTLHGTDITVLGTEPGFEPAVAFSINESDVVTAVSHHLRQETVTRFNITRPIAVVHNFIDPDVYYRRYDPQLRARFAAPDEKIVIHVSNFRPVKQPLVVALAFAGVCTQIKARLLLVGDGPELRSTYQHAQDLGVADRIHVLGNQDDVISLLSIADLFFLPSRSESFGLAALEAMACGVPVVASAVGGLPEVVVDEVSGYLCALDDVDGMVRRMVEILSDEDKHQRMAAMARERARAEFAQDRLVTEYERLYEQAICGK